MKKNDPYSFNFFRWQTWPLALRFTLIFTVMLVSLIILLTAIRIRQERVSRQHDVEHQAAVMLGSLAIAGYDLLMARDMERLGALQAQLETVETVEAVRFYAANGRLLTAPDQPPDSFGQEVVAAESIVYRWEPDRLLAGCAIIMDDELLGGISITLSTTHWEEKITAVEKNAILIAIGAILGSIIVAGLVSRSITDSLRKLVVAATELAAGNLQARAVGLQGGEIGHLADSFNSMANQLTTQVADLEQRVAAQTEDLHQSNMELTKQLQARQVVQQRYQALFDRTTDAIFLFSLDFVYIAVNQRAADLLGYTVDELIGMSVHQIIAPEDASLSLQKAEQVLLGEPIPAYERLLLHRDGRRITVEINIVAVYDEQGTPSHFQGIVRDVSRRKQAEEASRQSQKLESLGRMSGGIAHDFNNLLTAMLAQSSLIEAKLPETAPVRKHVERVVKAARRAAELTQQLLAYSGQNPLDIKSVQLNEVVEESVHLFEVALPKNVTLTVDLAAALPYIRGDFSQIQQVVLNLILNAAEALAGEAGMVAIGSSLCEIVQETAVSYTNTTLQPGHYVSLSIADNGVGMSKETLLKIFDPFFTTKKTGRGLGLAAALGIIRSHEGGLLVETTPGEGSRFELLFPVGEQQQAVPVEKPESIVVTSDKAHTVLVIDDEPFVREAAVDILELAGIGVITAENGYEGIRLYQAHQAEIDLVLLDMSMPGLNGEETFAELYQIDPQVNVILSSGYSDVDASPAFMESGIRTFLQKPYSWDKLLQTVQRYLAEPLSAA